MSRAIQHAIEPQDELRDMVEFAKGNPEYARKAFPVVAALHATARSTWHEVLWELSEWPEADIETGVMMLAWARDEVFRTQDALQRIVKATGAQENET